jgi:hypothetical protein
MQGCGKQQFRPWLGGEDGSMAKDQQIRGFHDHGFQERIIIGHADSVELESRKRMNWGKTR